MRTHSAEVSAVIHAINTMGPRDEHLRKDVVLMAASIYHPSRGGATPRQSISSTITHMCKRYGGKWETVTGLLKCRDDGNNMYISIRE